MRTILFSFLLFCLSSVFAQPRYTGETMYVIAQSGLNVRAKPALDGARLGKLAYGEEVEVGSLYGHLTVSGREGNWQEVDFDGKTGYVFNGYLSVIPAPSTQMKPDDMPCSDLEWFGPEPLLREYIDTRLTPKGDFQILVEAKSTEEGYHETKLRIYQKGVLVVHDVWYEASTLRMRVFGMTQAQALAFVEALLSPCKGTSVANPTYTYVKTEQEELIQVRDKESYGEQIVIHMIDYLTVEIAFSSGV